MSSLPAPETYEREYTYWPWARAIAAVAKLIGEVAPVGVTVVDYMCGTGRLLRDIRRMRPDLRLIGCDINESYVNFARAQDSHVSYVLCSAMDYRPPTRAAVAACTAGLHHLPPPRQSELLRAIWNDLIPGGRLFVGEEVIRDDSDDRLRARSVMDLWSGILGEIIDAGGTRDVVDAAIEVLRADLFLDGEYKMTAPALASLLSVDFVIDETQWTWQTPGGLAGDLVVECHKSTTTAAPHQSMSPL